MIKNRFKCTSLSIADETQHTLLASEMWVIESPTGRLQTGGRVQGLIRNRHPLLVRFRWGRAWLNWKNAKVGRSS